MTYQCDFICPSCGQDFEAEWTFTDVIQCPECKKWWETDFETNWDDDIQGPWLTFELGEAG